MIRETAVISSGTKLRLLFHVLMLLSFALELPQYFAWVTNPNIKINIHTNKNKTLLLMMGGDKNMPSKRLNLFHPDND